MRTVGKTAKDRKSRANQPGCRQPGPGHRPLPDRPETSPLPRTVFALITLPSMRSHLSTGQPLTNPH